ncbi:MAG: M48 family metallopeptidase [Candidatus Pacebacteria bacterium]|nr:M48 family metallopeptidase [Candidatus Paceibacterota bacterium]
MNKKASLLKYAETARLLVHTRLVYFNQFYNFKYGTVRIKAQTTRWGSCSSKGNLNFNYRIVLLPAHLADYIVVHELCHLGQFNHSQKFWDLVANTLPNFKLLRNELKMLYSSHDSGHRVGYFKTRT